ncbi:MAG: hypothetical protein WDM77_22090 [Steroidobacteraceae bacterium]
MQFQSRDDRGQSGALETIHADGAEARDGARLHIEAHRKLTRIRQFIDLGVINLGEGIPLILQCRQKCGPCIQNVCGDRRLTGPQFQ